MLQAADLATLPTNDAAAGKWGLAGLDLASATSPAAPVSMMMNAVAANVPAGAGLFEFPIYNPTNEPIHLSVDLTLPAPVSTGSPLTVATWNTSSYANRWVYRDTTTNIACGSVFDDPVYVPDYSLPGCNIDPPLGGSSTPVPASGNVPAADFTIRAWMTDQTTTTLTELSQCAGCSTTPVGSNRVRVTVLVPPRGSVTSRPPVKVTIMPALRPNAAYRPAGSTASPTVEFSAAGQFLTGNNLASATACVQWSPGATSPSPTTFRCTRTRSYTLAKYASSITVGGTGGQFANLATGIAGDTTATPLHLGSNTFRMFSPSGASWSTSEPAPPAL
ncbi:MAG: hypothetical protein R3B06_27955 [Kofleriaceae bacterium]